MATATRTAKTQWVWIGKATTLHVYVAFLYISLLSLHDYNVRVPNFTFCRGCERRQGLSFSFPELWYSLLEFNSRKICQNLTNWTSWSKGDKVWSSVNSLFKWRFRRHRRLKLPDIQLPQSAIRDRLKGLIISEQIVILNPNNFLFKKTFGPLHQNLDTKCCFLLLPGSFILF